MTRKFKNGVAEVSYQDLQEEVRRRERRIGTLQRRRSRLARRIAKLDELISLLGGPSGARSTTSVSRLRPKNEAKLLDAILALLRNKTMQVRDIAGALICAGYRTNAANFKAVVQQTLMNNKGAFHRVGRGRYKAS